MAEPPKPPPPKPGLFSGKPAAPMQPQQNNTDLAAQVNNISTRIRILEERYTNVRKKMQLTDQNMLSSNKDLKREMKVTQSDVDDLRKDLEDMKKNVRLIIKELKECAKSEEIKVLERYINMWEPVNFVTATQVEKIVEAKILEMNSQDYHQ